MYFLCKDVIYIFRINTVLRNKMEFWECDRCQIDVSVTLPHSEFEDFRHNTLRDQDFIANSLSDLEKTNDKTRHCIMVLDEEADDGILVDPQGYNYARYSAYIPNAKQLMQTQYPSLDDFNDRMRRAVDKYVGLALENHDNGKYSFDIEDVNRHYDCENFNSDLFVDMIGECAEFSDVEYYGGEFTVTLNPEYLSENDKQLYNEDIKEICARHTLWILDVEGGKRADFSGRNVSEFDFDGVDLNGADFENARFSNCNFESACLMGAKMNNAVFKNCSFKLATSEEVEAKRAVFNNCNFEQADFITSNFKGAVFQNCNFDCISIENSCIEGTNFHETIPDAEEIERCYKTEDGFLAEEKSNGLEPNPLS